MTDITTRNLKNVREREFFGSLLDFATTKNVEKHKLYPDDDECATKELVNYHTTNVSTRQGCGAGFKRNF